MSSRVPGELAAALVLSTVAACMLDTVDPGPALARPGVVAVLDHRDIPGSNNLTAHKKFAQELFASDRVSHAGQVIGVVVAEDTETAHAAARLVRVTYKERRQPVLSIDDVLGREAGLSLTHFYVLSFYKQIQGKCPKLARNRHKSVYT